MMPSSRHIALLTFAFLAAPLQAQRHADLAPAEVDQLRDAAMEPDVRLKLYLKFARARLDTLEQVPNDPKTAAADRPAQIHDRLQDFVDLYDELNDNIDTYVDRRDDIRKPLRAIIDADTEFETKLKAFQQAAIASKENMKSYEFMLSNAIDDLTSSADDHRKLLGDLELAAKNSKKKKPHGADEGPN